MKISKQDLQHIIKEELDLVLEQTYKAGRGAKDVISSIVAQTRREQEAEKPVKPANLSSDDKRALELARRFSLEEDGHEDTSSARRAMKTIIEDAGQMLQALDQMDGHLPTWWTNKMAVAANNLNKMRDYLLVPSSELRGAAENIADLKFADNMRDREEMDAQLQRDREEFSD